MPISARVGVGFSGPSIWVVPEDVQRNPVVGGQCKEGSVPEWYRSGCVVPSGYCTIGARGRGSAGMFAKLANIDGPLRAWGSICCSTDGTTKLVSAPLRARTARKRKTRKKFRNSPALTRVGAGNYNICWSFHQRPALTRVDGALSNCPIFGQLPMARTRVARWLHCYYQRHEHADGPYARGPMARTRVGNKL